MNKLLCFCVRESEGSPGQDLDWLVEQEGEGMAAEGMLCLKGVASMRSVAVEHAIEVRLLEF